MNNVRVDVRNVAVLASIDDGKTTLIDAVLSHCNALPSRGVAQERILDSDALERERGITIRSKVASVEHRGVRINIVDTPGHADLASEVERALSVVDGVLLLVDATKGTRPHTRFILSRILSSRLPIVLAVTKNDRVEARPEDVVNEIYYQLCDLDADPSDLEFPVVYVSAREGWSSLDAGTREPGLDRLLDSLVDALPAPTYEDSAPLRALVVDVFDSQYLGRLAVCRVRDGRVHVGSEVFVAGSKHIDSSGRVSSLLQTIGLDAADVREAAPGDIVTLAGLSTIAIGDTIAGSADITPLPTMNIDEPNLFLTIGVNNSPLAGTEGQRPSLSRLRDRLWEEQQRDPSLTISHDVLSDEITIASGGVLRLSLLVETLRREGFELTVGKPHPIIKESEGTLLEPFESISIEIGSSHIGAVSQLLADRLVRIEQLSNQEGGGVILHAVGPSRGLLGLPGALQAVTGGSCRSYQAHEGYRPLAGKIESRATGSLVADRPGEATAHALLSIRERGRLFINPGDSVYEGMIVGEHHYQQDLPVNPTRARQLSNMRSATAEELVRLPPAFELSIEEALDFIRGDECIEVTRRAIRLRKRMLSASERKRHSHRRTHVG